MKGQETMERDERLRAALRRGDPAAEAEGLTAEEAQAMRRTMLSAVPAEKERFRLLPVWVTAAVAVLSCVVGLSLWRAHDQPPVTEPAAALRPVLPAPPMTVAQAPAPPAPAAVRPAVAVPPVRSERAVRPLPRPAPVVTPPTAPEPQAQSLSAPMRQVQFSAPGGTRIVWMLPAEPTTR
jgi:hypothetical protein